MNQISIGSNSLPSYNSLTISTINQLENLLNDQFGKRILKNLIISANSLNDLKTTLEISGFDNLEKIVVGGGSLQNLNSLKICNNEKLNTIEIEDYAFRFVLNVIIESINNFLNNYFQIFLIYNHLNQVHTHSIKHRVSLSQVIHTTFTSNLNRCYESTILQYRRKIIL